MGHVNSVLMAISTLREPDGVSEDTLGERFLLRLEDFQYPMGHISFVGKLDGETLKAGAPAIAPGFTLDMMASHSLDFWLTSEDLPDPEEPRHARPRRQHRPQLQAEQRRRPQAPDRRG